MPYFEARDGERLWYETYGPDEGRPLLCLHGFTGSHAHFSDLALSLPEDRVVTPDLYGHGWSSVPADLARLGLSPMGEDLWTLVTELGWSGPVVLLGYSMGGRLALDMALRRPERVAGLVLESASPGIHDDSERRQRAMDDDALAERIVAGGVDRFVEYWEELPLFRSQKDLDPALQEHIRRDRQSHSAEGLAQSLRGTGVGRQLSWWDALAGFRRPVLLIAGDQDAKYQGISREMAARFPHAVLEVIEGAGHTPHVEHPEAFQTVVREFLGTLAP